MIQQELYLAERVIEGLSQRTMQDVGPLGASASANAQRRQGLGSRGRWLLSRIALRLVSFGGRLVGWGMPYHRSLESEA